MNVQLSRQILDKCNEAENIAHVYTFPEVNPQFLNQEHRPYQFSNMSTIPGQHPHQGHYGDAFHHDGYGHYPPYELEAVNSPGHQHCGEGQCAPRFELMEMPREQIFVRPKVSQMFRFLTIRMANFKNANVKEHPADHLRHTSRDPRP